MLQGTMMKWTGYYRALASTQSGGLMVLTAVAKVTTFEGLRKSVAQ